MRYVVSAVVITALLAAGPACAAVLCQKRSGAVFVRPTACRKKEKAVDLTQFGAAGPKGDKGDPGAAGAAGAARAYGRILSDGTLDASHDNAGIVGVRKTPTYTCVKLAPSIDATKAIVHVGEIDPNLDGLPSGGTGHIGGPRYRGVTSTCAAGNEVTVAGVVDFTFTSGALTGYGVGPDDFFIVVQ